MTRSFTDRVLAGVCGGIGSALGVNAWLVRFLFVVMTLLSLGGYAVLYLSLWLIMPEQSLATSRRSSGFGMIMTLFLVIVVTVLWVLNLSGNLQVSDYANLYYPALLMCLSLVYLVYQVRS